MRKTNSNRFFGEFKTFALRGNVIDLAVGVIVGGAFSGITNSLVNDIIMPFVGLFLGKDTFTNVILTLGPILPNQQAASLNIGSFIQTVINFAILAFVVFCLVKGINRLRRKEETPTPPAPATPSQEELLLTEIRDLLKENPHV